MPRTSIHAAAILAGVTLLGSTIGHAGGPPPPAAVDLTRIGIDNFGRVNTIYYRGAEPADSQYAALAKLGIKTVVDLRGSDVDPGDRRLVEIAGMRYTQIPMTTHEAPTSEMVDVFLKTVNEPANQPVYVHCVGGRHRTGVMTAIYRMSHDGWSSEQAFKEMKEYKFGADFLHPEFKKFVYGYATIRASAPQAPKV